MTYHNIDVILNREKFVIVMPFKEVVMRYSTLIFILFYGICAYHLTNATDGFVEWIVALTFFTIIGAIAILFVAAAFTFREKFTKHQIEW